MAQVMAGAGAAVEAMMVVEASTVVTAMSVPGSVCLSDLRSGGARGIMRLTTMIDTIMVPLITARHGLSSMTHRRWCIFSGNRNKFGSTALLLQVITRTSRLARNNGCRLIQNQLRNRRSDVTDVRIKIGCHLRRTTGVTEYGH